jgi:hypothetical protein
MTPHPRRVPSGLVLHLESFEPGVGISSRGLGDALGTLRGTKVFEPLPDDEAVLIERSRAPSRGSKERHVIGDVGVPKDRIKCAGHPVLLVLCQGSRICPGQGICSVSGRFRGAHPSPSQAR